MGRWLQSFCDTYRALKGVLRLAAGGLAIGLFHERAAERKAQTQSLASKIRAVSGILRHQIDPMVNLFRRTNPDFVAGYRAARVIIERPATRAAAASPTTPPTPPTPHTP